MPDTFIRMYKIHSENLRNPGNDHQVLKNICNLVNLTALFEKGLEHKGMKKLEALESFRNELIDMARDLANKILKQEKTNENTTLCT